jgi:hypothetical protein
MSAPPFESHLQNPYISYRLQVNGLIRKLTKGLHIKTFEFIFLELQKIKRRRRQVVQLKQY